MKEIITPEVAQNIIDRLNEAANAKIFQGNTQRPFSVQSITLNLTTGSVNPYKIGGAFRSVFVVSATDTSTTINLQPNSADSYQSAIPMKLNDAWSSEYPISEAYLSWSAQSGKSITILLFVDSEFRPGSQISVVGGGVSISEGSAFTTSQVSLTAATATLVAASNSSRKLTSFQNNTGGPVWFGGSSVSNTGANQGQRCEAGAIFYWRNSAALYAYSVAGGSGDSGLHSFEET